MMSKKSPQLRFEGFTDDWEVRKLNEVSDIYDGTHQTPNYQDNGVMFLSVENIKTLTSNKFISREAFEDEFKIRPQRGDVLMTRIGDIGTANVVETDEDLAYYVSLALFKSEELNPYFLQASIYAPFVQDQIWKRTLHIAFPKKINKNEIGQVPINVPTLAEQTKIGSFFKQLDKTIALHQRKLDLLKEQKKGYLQKMFPKNGAKVPELRFAGFADDWEERKLGDYVIIRSGWSPSNFDINNNANNLFIKVDDLNYSTRVQKESQVKVNILSKYKKMKKSSTIFPKRGAAIMTNKVRMLGEDSYMDTNMMALEPKGIDPEYLYTFINKTGLYKIADTSTIPQINNKHIEPYLLLIPSLEEQHKIGSFFKQLDETIALHQRKLDLLKEQKKGYLQKMFV